MPCKLTASRGKKGESTLHLVKNSRLSSYIFCLLLCFGLFFFVVDHFIQKCKALKNLSTRLSWLLGWVLGFRHGADLGLAVVLCWAYLRSHKVVRKRIKKFFEDYERRHREIQEQIGNKR